MRDPAGQSSLEYLALLALVVLLLVAGTAGLAAAGIPPAISLQLARGLCIVRAGDCERDRAPCVVAVRSASNEVALRLAVLRLRGGRVLLRERLSGGAERVTLVHRAGLGLGALLGGSLGVGGRSIGAELQAAVEVRAGSGSTWVVPDAAAADRLERRLAIPAPALRRGLPPARPALPEPDVVSGDRSLDTALAAGLGRLGVELDIEDLRASRVDRRTGERTIQVRRRRDVLAGLSLLGPIGAEGGGRREERWALVTDARGRPLDLVVTSVQRLLAGVRLPRALRGIVMRADVPLRRGRIVEREEHLDLTEPRSLVAASALLRVLRSARPRSADAFAVSRELRRRLDEAGVAHTRVYALEVEHSGARAGAGAGVGLGGSYEHVVERARLIGATVRTPAGGERVREDCAA